MATAADRLGGGSGGDTPPATGWQSGVYQPASNFVASARRRAPARIRQPACPIRTAPAPLLDENNWLRSWTNDLYLWYGEVSDQDPALFATTDALFRRAQDHRDDRLRARHKDKFHFTYPTADWDALSQGGVQVGYGAQWVDHCRDVRRARSWWPTPSRVRRRWRRGQPRARRPGAAASMASISSTTTRRPASTRSMPACFPAAANETHVFQILDLGATTSRTVTMVSADVTSHPVQNVSTIATAIRPGRLHAVQRSPGDRGSGAGQRLHHAAGRGRQRPGARPPLQRRRLSRYRERGRLHDRRARRRPPARPSSCSSSTTSTRPSIR